MEKRENESPIPAPTPVFPALTRSLAQSHLVSLDPPQRNQYDVSSRVARERLNETRLSRAGGSVEQQPQLVRVALDGVPALLGLEIAQDLEKFVLLREKERVEVLVTAKLVALVPVYVFVGSSACARSC